MTKKTKYDLLTSLTLIIISAITIMLPLLNVTKVDIAFIIIMLVYVISNLINYLLVIKTKDKEGLYTGLISLISIGLLFAFNINANPMNLAIVLLVWALGMALVKLKKADYYHDRTNKLWIVHIITLFIFILISLLTAVNLFHENAVQVLIIGNYFFINGLLDLVDPLINFIKENK